MIIELSWFCHDVN